MLHVSLRDLAPEILLGSANIVDDVEHCLKANTSPHLAEQLTGNRYFLLGTLDDVMAGRVTVPADRPVVFSPFGLGVLDLAVGKYVYDEVVQSGELLVIDEFFHGLRRYGLRSWVLRRTRGGWRRAGSGITLPPASGDSLATRRALPADYIVLRYCWLLPGLPFFQGLDWRKGNRDALSPSPSATPAQPAARILPRRSESQYRHAI